MPYFETSIGSRKASAAAILLAVLFLPRQLEATSPPKPKLCPISNSVPTSIRYVIPQGTHTATLKYTIKDALGGPDRAYRCDIDGPHPPPTYVPG